MLPSHRQEPIHIDVGSVFEPSGERNVRRERTLSKLLDVFNELGRRDPAEVDPIGLFYPVPVPGTARISKIKIIDIAQHASFEDDGDVRKSNVQSILYAVLKMSYSGQLV
jgi:hypothetical protein